MKPYLVLLRAGPATDWPRTRDAFASEFVDVGVAWNGARAPALPGAAFVHACEGARWPALAQTLAALSGVLGACRQVWMPAEGVACTAEETARLFAICDHLGLELAQPAFVPATPVAHPVAWQHGRFQARFTNFVDPAAPVFSLAMLARSLDLLAECEDGPAAGLVWPRLSRLGRVAVVDAVTVQRTVPALAAEGSDEVARFVEADRPISLGGLLDSGDALCLGDSPLAADAFVDALEQSCRRFPLGTGRRLRYLASHLDKPGTAARLPVRELLERAQAGAGLRFNRVLPPPADDDASALRAERDHLASLLAQVGQRLAPAARIGHELLAPRPHARAA